MIFFLVVSFLIVIFDQITKVLITRSLALYESVSIIKGLFSFTYVQNRGAAFGILQGARVFFVIITIALLIFVVGYIIRKKPQNLLEKTAISFITGGALGNFIDRAYLGYVRDFISTDFIDFPVFNVADCFVCIGAALYVIFVLCEGKQNGNNKTDSAQ